MRNDVACGNRRLRNVQQTKQRQRRDNSRGTRGNEVADRNRKVGGNKRKFRQNNGMVDNNFHEKKNEMMKILR